MGDKPLHKYVVLTDAGWRTWDAEDAEHAVEQHMDAFPDEDIMAEPTLFVPLPKDEGK